MSRTRSRAVALASSFALVVSLAVALAAAPASACAGCSYSAWDPTEQAGSGVQVGGSYKPIVGNFAGDRSSDILWYSPGKGVDSLWTGTGTRGAFTKQSVTVNGTYTPIVGNFAGDTYDDILWYAPGTAADTLWTSVETGGPFSSSTLTVNGRFTPVVLHRWATTPSAVPAKGLSRSTPRVASVTLSSIVWYAPGAAADSVWVFKDTSPGAHASVSVSVPGSPKLVPFNRGNDLNEDLLLYTAGSGYDGVWTYDGAGHFTIAGPSVSGTYTPYAVGDPGAQSILWVGAGSRPDNYWSNVGGTFTTTSTEAVTAPGPAVRIFAGGAYLYDPAGPDQNWDGGVTASSTSTDIGSGYQLLAGDYDGDGQPDAFWYKPGTGTERLLYGIPSAP